MNILLDTTYFLPGFGISIKPLVKDILEKILAVEEVEKIHVAEIMFFEIAAKASKLASANECLIMDQKIRLLQQDDTYNIVASHMENVWAIACCLRKYHKDYLDCLHWSSALLVADTFITEDRKIFELAKMKELVEEIEIKFGLKYVEVVNSKTFTERYRGKRN